VSNPYQDGTAPTYQPVQPQPPATKQTNGFAIAALIFGIIGGSILGLIFGIIGLRRSKSTGTGRGMSIAGIVLSVLWLIAAIAIVIVVATAASKQADPGCVQYRSIVDSSAVTDPSSFGSIADQLRDAAAKAENAEAKAAIGTLAEDFDNLVAAIQSGNLPPNLEAELTAHEEAANSACGYLTVDE
jgi:hypothetical protein